MKIFFLLFFFTLITTVVLIKMWIAHTDNRESIKDILLHHQHKSHTPTRGGICIFLALSPCFILTDNYLFLLISSCGVLIGWWDDKNKRHGGLSNYVRIFLWSVIGLLLSTYRYYLHGGIIFIPILNIYWNLNYLYIFFTGICMFLGSINGTNMTDGLDGMVTFPLILNTLFICIVSFHMGNGSIFLLSGGIMGALMGFLYMNITKAKIFMGDTGSVFLGMLIGSLFIMLKIECFFLISAMVFAINVISSFLQVFSIRYFKRRIFKMAPLHHHFELLGYSESEIVFRVWWWSLIFFIIALGVYFYGM